MLNDITQIDKNFVTNTTIDKEDVVFYDPGKAPFSVHGVSHDGERYRRLPKAVAESVSERVGVLSGHTSGGRVRFRTDSPYVAIHAEMPTIGKMPHFALSGSAGFDLYADGCYVKTFVPPFKITDGFDGVIELGTAQMREITINFPLYSSVSTLYIGLSSEAAVSAPAAYKHPKPVVFYGSSITQGGCASRPGNCYTAILSRKLDCDYINLGFSGSGKAEDEIAAYIAGLDMSVFVYDYDHNAPDAAHLEKTHEKMFQTIRQAHPKLPIIVMGRPKYTLTKEEKKRFAIIEATCEHARAKGDINVHLLSGPELMALAGNEGTVDGCHPNDLGFASMARTLEPLLSLILKHLG